MEVLPPPALSGGHPVVDRLHEPGVPSLNEVAGLWDLLDKWVDVVCAAEGRDGVARQSAQLGTVSQTVVSQRVAIS